MCSISSCSCWNVIRYSKHEPKSSEKCYAKFESVQKSSVSTFEGPMCRLNLAEAPRGWAFRLAKEVRYSHKSIGVSGRSA